ncbi:helix-turn-helix domain-containing protein [Actinoplanes friuliensis]|jgi:DNA-binding transcriptional ArsR family regulator|uniref:Putative ArsR-family transcriptional regulator n=1 Tax=Actinoplanes friuliensis DSM 7358 TaxID=1246995 RepID=U5W8Z4_9ACTN|nr:helix-turn-helix domain-containing protein [Actinoplanes friuliensis]AGZ44411.1 putative ArsR-family transcriptional regulator [Actinoplanes friuliensis DSM 7358]
MEPTQVTLDAKQIRVLAHPLRARLLGRLRLDGPATATRLAEVLGTNTGATSYHLRQLADVGLVLDEEGAGKGRERWWRAAHDYSSWRRDSFAGDPDAVAAADWLDSNALRFLVDRVERWQRVRADDSPEWRAASGFSDYMINLGTEQLNALMDELDATVERYRALSESAPAPDARQVLIYLYGVPRVEESS